MEDKEKYGIELEAETSDFKKQMQDVAETTRKFGKEIKEDLNIKPNIDKKEVQQSTELIAETLKKNFRNIGKNIKESLGLNIDQMLDYQDLEARSRKYNSKMTELVEDFKQARWRYNADLRAGKDESARQSLKELETVSDEIKGLENTITRINRNKLDILDYNQLNTYIENLKNKIISLDDLLQERKKAQKLAGRWSTDDFEVENIQEELYLTNEELTIAELKAQKFTDNIKEAEKETSKLSEIVGTIKDGFSNLGERISTGFSKVVKNIKRVSMAMLGIHSAYRILSRAVSTYSQYDIEYTQKMKSAWASLGAFLAPLTSMIGTAVQKMVGYLNVFIKALTGVDYIAKANEAYKYSKAIKSIGKSANEALTPLDEITNIQEQSASGGVDDDFNPFEAVQNVELDDKWVERMTKLGKAVKKVYDNFLKPFIKGVIDFITTANEEDWDDLIDDALALGTAFATWKLDPELAVTLGLIVKALEEIFDYNKNPSDTQFGKVLTWLGIAIGAIGAFFLGLPTLIAGAIVTLWGVIGTNFEKVKDVATKISDFIGGNIGSLIKLSLDNFDKTYHAFKTLMDGIVGIFKGDAEAIKNLIKGLVNALIGLLNIGLIAPLNTILSPIRKIISGIGGLFSKSINMDTVKIPNIPYLDTGTAYVPEDGLAMIHKGEAVIPKKFNSEEYFNNIGNNETTNALLVELIEAVEENGEKVPVFNLNGKEFARATYNDFENEKYSRNKNTVIRRV